jgi:alpha-beta hydrolase superfamily lysophospholipase
MMPATKESYVKLAEELQRRGVASLAIDFRGHGESDGGPNGYEQFTDVEQQAKRRDVHAATRWMYRTVARIDSFQDLAKSVAPEVNDSQLFQGRFVIVGASIGANLAFDSFVNGEFGLRYAVLLSPGINYHGIVTEPTAERVAAVSYQSALLAAGGADDAYSTASVQKLAKILGDRATVRTFAQAGHGTTMFEREPIFLTEVADWIAYHCQ